MTDKSLHHLFRSRIPPT